MSSQPVGVKTLGFLKETRRWTPSPMARSSLSPDDSEENDWSAILNIVKDPVVSGNLMH